MTSPKEVEATEYLKKHKILELMDNLTSMVFFHRPGEHCFRYPLAIENVGQCKVKSATRGRMKNR